jgi:hypothetical protein
MPSLSSRPRVAPKRGAPGNTTVTPFAVRSRVVILANKVTPKRDARNITMETLSVAKSPPVISVRRVTPRRDAGGTTGATPFAGRRRPGFGALLGDFALGGRGSGVRPGFGRNPRAFPGHRLMAAARRPGRGRPCRFPAPRQKPQAPPPRRPGGRPPRAFRCCPPGFCPNPARSQFFLGAASAGASALPGVRPHRRLPGGRGAGQGIHGAGFPVPKGSFAVLRKERRLAPPGGGLSRLRPYGRGRGGLGPEGESLKSSCKCRSRMYSFCDFSSQSAMKL